MISSRKIKDVLGDIAAIILGAAAALIVLYS
jgi:hypothetical protein